MHRKNSLFTNTQDRKTLAIIHPKRTQELYTNMYAHTTCTWKINQERSFFAMMPSSRQGCAEHLDDLYYHRAPLPRIPGCHKLDKQARLADVHERHVASNTWHAQLVSLARSISKTGLIKLLCMITGTSQSTLIAYNFYLAPSLHIIAKTL